MENHKFSYNWNLKNGYPSKGIVKHNSKVFSCFACGGGSTMGYKLAGYDVLGMNEIDPKMAACYIENHKPKMTYIEPIQTFKERNDLPKELYQLDILDGSPPCSSFSTVGNRDKDWGKNKKFREGQSKQVLDTLFFDFIDLAKKLQPKVVIAENVKGLLMGKAKAYVSKIYSEFDKAGYYCQHWLLEASKMGVPQRRERVFFVCLRKDLAGQFLYQKDMFTSVPRLDLCFDEKGITFSEIECDKDAIPMYTVPPCFSDLYDKVKKGKSFSTAHPKGSLFSAYKTNPREVLKTFLPHDKNRAGPFHYKTNRTLTKLEIKKAGTFPIDYVCTKSNISYLVGMSVPPIMTAQISSSIYDQWLSKIN